MYFVTATDNADIDVPMDTTQANTLSLENSKTSSSRNGKSSRDVYFSYNKTNILIHRLINISLYAKNPTLLNKNCICCL